MSSQEKNQRQRDQQCFGFHATFESSNERKCERDAKAHQIVPPNPTKRQQEQERSTAARRKLRLGDLQRKSDEKVFDLFVTW